MASQACHLSCFYIDKMMYDVLIGPEEYEGAPGCDALLSTENDVPFWDMHKAKMDNGTYNSGSGSSIGNTFAFEIIQ